MDDNRLIDIESKIAHQEHLLDELNQVLTSQQAQIARLEAMCSGMLERLKSMAEQPDSAGANNDERPPHY